jgi:hypothetical protein
LTAIPTVIRPTGASRAGSIFLCIEFLSLVELSLLKPLLMPQPSLKLVRLLTKLLPYDEYSAHCTILEAASRSGCCRRHGSGQVLPPRLSSALREELSSMPWALHVFSGIILVESPKPIVAAFTESLLLSLIIPFSSTKRPLYVWYSNARSWSVQIEYGSILSSSST